LLVLDNFEQVLDAGLLLVDCLVACPELKLLVTSRETLNLAGERDYPVPPMSLPVPRESETVNALRNVESIRLFVERTEASQPDFTLDETNSPDVAAICNRLQGVPLAIELAAAQMIPFPPAECLPRLERCLPLLRDGPRDAPFRHRTMRDAIFWSDDLLSNDEQTLFRCLGVFVGGFTLDAAEAVNRGGGEDIASPDSSTSRLLDLITPLVRKNLIRRTVVPADQTRFSMLETIREFALERLGNDDEEHVVRRNHAEYFQALAACAYHDLHLPKGLDRLSILTTEYANLRSALEWFRDQHLPMTC
jgi:predicted ATPase